MANASLFEELYREVILDHSRNPKNRGRLPSPTRTVEGMNPVCGDEVILDVELTETCLTCLGFEGQGCAISQASASLMTERLTGVSTGEARQVCNAVRAMLVQGGEPAAILGDLEALHGVAKFPVRVKCAMLAWTLLEGVLESEALTSGEKP